ncbi:Transcriptional activator chrR [Enhygromyxa salina]|uniref:Transcriptional activator chrR n=1 Tax=Enhygromyxa salina TaxID=215803 RepID=A0A0C2D585_9BACT|nr:Transcriptional activator chrR [Enhygromyxa salina]
MPDEVLLEYAAGAADPGHALIVACHLTLCPTCRQTVASYEALGAALTGVSTAISTPTANEDTLVARIMAGVDPTLPSETETVELPSTDPPASPHDAVFPWPLQQIIGPFKRLAWRRRLPGLRTFDVAISGARTVIRMIEAGPGMKVVGHGHTGLELDLVLAGGLEDLTRGGEFERGDIQRADADVTHTLEVLPGEPCLLLTVNEGPFVPDGLYSRLVYRYLGWS